MKYKIITISREFGSGGHSIGKAVAEKLNIPFYDQILLEHIAIETGFSQEFIQKLFSIYLTAPKRDIIAEQEGVEADEKKLSE